MPPSGGPATSNSELRWAWRALTVEFAIEPGNSHSRLSRGVVDGWISASLHRSLDGTRVVNYAQSADRDAAGRVFKHLNARGMIEGNKAFGEAHPGLYEVVFTLDRDG